MFLTTRDYIVRPPELVSQGDIDLVQTADIYRFQVPRLGIRIGYTNESQDDRVAALENDNPYVRLHFRHVTVRSQMRVQEVEIPMEECVVSNVYGVCPVFNSSQSLQGTFYKEDYQFVEITVDKCVGEPVCANLTVINALLQSGQFRIRAYLGLEAEQFDVERFHTTGVGQVGSNRSLEFFNLPGVEVQSDIVFKARKISKEQHFIGSPPIPEIETNILSFDRKETTFRPRSVREVNLLSFYIRIDDNVRLEEVSYWCPSILDLFGLWGAMASFAASLSIGFVAMTYNRWSFERHFRHMAETKRREAQLMTLSSMEWMRKKENHPTTRNRGDIYKSLQEQHDALMVEPDLRLFESHQFDSDGRVTMSAAELKHPSTAFGELRRLAIVEHGKKKRAAFFLSIWYGRHLVKSGFIQDPERKRELFSPMEGIIALDYRYRQRKRGKLRRRFRHRQHQISDYRLDIENPVVKKEKELEGTARLDSSGDSGEETSPQRLEIPLGFSEDEKQSGGIDIEPEQEAALQIIAELDPLTKTSQPKSA